MAFFLFALDKVVKFRAHYNIHSVLFNSFLFLLGNLQKKMREIFIFFILHKCEVHWLLGCNFEFTVIFSNRKIMVRLISESLCTVSMVMQVFIFFAYLQERLKCLRMWLDTMSFFSGLV